MFISRLERGLLFSPESEGGAGGGNGGADNQAGGDQSQKPVVTEGDNVSVESLKAEREALLNAKNEILAEKKKLQSELDSYKKANTEEVKKKAQEEKNFEKLLQIELEAKKEIADKLELYERNQTEQTLKVVKTQMWNAFTKELGAELHDPTVAEKLVAWDKFVADEKSKYGFNEDGIKQAVNEFRNKHSYMLKTVESQVSGAAAKSTAGDSSKKSFAERMADAGSVIGKR